MRTRRDCSRICITWRGPPLRPDTQRIRQPSGSFFLHLPRRGNTAHSLHVSSRSRSRSRSSASSASAIKSLEIPTHCAKAETVGYCLGLDVSGIRIQLPPVAWLLSCLRALPLQPNSRQNIYYRKLRNCFQNRVCTEMLGHADAFQRLRAAVE